MDEFRYNADSASKPARSLESVTPDDGAGFQRLPKALFVGSGGDISLRGVEDTTPTVLKNVLSGQILPIRAIQVYQTGTTAGDIVALL